METIPRRDDINGNHSHPATIHGGPRVANEPGQMVHRIDYPTPRITHGQWIYRNYVVHDPVSSTLATAKKEELLAEIERQRELSDTGLLEEDKYLAEANLEDMATSSGERQHYWLLAIQTARNHYTLKTQQETQQTVHSNTTRERGR